MARKKASKLTRKKATRAPKRIIYIFCEGENTEPKYFEALRRTLKHTLLELRLFPAAGVPDTLARNARTLMQEKGLNRKSRKGRNSYEQNDQVWVVFDRDQHPRYEETVYLCEQQRIGVARSDPCFELWLILHYQDFDRCLDHHAIQKELEDLDENYSSRSRKEANFDLIVANVEQAEARAERQLANRDAEGSELGTPSTTVFRLTREIRTFDPDF